MNRTELSKKYLPSSGQGLEIGALHFPWPMANGAKAKNMDRFPKEELIRQYPEHSPGSIAEVDLIGNGFECYDFDSDFFDFLVASHVFEHAEDPIASLQNWFRVVKSGGLLLLAVPEKTQSFDRDRLITPFYHVWADYLVGAYTDLTRADHYREYFSKVDKFIGDRLEQAVSHAMKTSAHIHFHCWDYGALKYLFDTLRFELGGFEILEFTMVHHEVLIVLKKTGKDDLQWRQRVFNPQHW